MSEGTNSTAGSAPARRPRAWWQWLIGIGLLGVAAFSLSVRALFHFRPELQYLNQVAPPIPIKLPDGMKEVPAVPADPGQYAGYNVLVVTLDTTRADRLGCYGNKKIKTPVLDGLARKGVLFSKAIAPGPTTLPSHASIFTGLHPFHHGARANGVFRLKEDKRTLAEVFSERGYATGAAISAFVLDSRYGLAQGFDAYEDAIQLTSDSFGHSDPERPGDQTTDVAISWLQQHRDKPFFYWIHYFDPHQPYEPPEPFASEYSHFPYDGEIAFVDTQMARLLDALREIGADEKTLIVVIGDHGQGLGQHVELTHGFLLYDSTLHIPFIMACGSKLGGGVNVAKWVSAVDVYPTLLSMVGFPSQEGLDGIDLTKAIPDDRVIYMETLEGLNQMGASPLLGVRRGNLKYIHGPIPEFFDLSNDPYEENNLLTKDKRAADELLAKLEAHYGSDLIAAAYAQPSEQLSDDDLQMLRALGYVNLGVTAPAAGGSLPDPKELMPLLYKAEAALNRMPGETVHHSIKRLKPVVEEHPDYYLALRYLAFCYMEAGDLDNAMVYFNRCIEIHPDVPYILISVARIAGRKGDIEGAIAQYENTIQKCPDYFPALYELGKLYLTHNQPTKASHLLMKACTVRPTDEDVVENLAEAMKRSERIDEAIEFFSEKLEKDRTLLRVRNALAGLKIGKGECDEGLQLMREGVEMYPDNPDLLTNLAFALTWCSRGSAAAVKEAVAIMEKLCEKTAYQDPHYIHTLTLAYAELFRLDEAIALAQRGRAVAREKDYVNLVNIFDAMLVELEEARRQGMTPMSIRGSMPTTQPVRPMD